MIKTQLTPCASLLYYWINSHIKTNQQLQLDWHNFQTWTEEFLEQSASMSEIRASLSQLNNLNLIAVEGTEVTIKNNLNNIGPKTLPLTESLSTKSGDNNPVIFGLLMILIFLILGFCYAAWLSRQEPIGTNYMIPTNPYQVLSEKF
ncbi:MAG: hypothetical protein F6J89_26560 [Symploca sp. SIO1C4]|uniref:Uncharacterized protein n=1 Tax=Symploca sp. SIO1C4 TaxID=2607765 RepID=A0A6B3NJP7_9CYAN|nr:hypothetical protein [Symploca sp. SIO1C4]NET03261.1 hypothetical protein [Symploca sp. SIO2B6]